MDNLALFVRKNPSLLHLDLSNTEMQDAMLRGIVDAVHESHSLMAVHLDGNPGISASLLAFIEEKLETKSPLAQENYIPGPTSKASGMDPQTMQETLLLKSILQKKKLNECTISIPTIDKSKLIL